MLHSLFLTKWHEKQWFLTLDRDVGPNQKEKTPERERGECEVSLRLQACISLGDG